MFYVCEECKRATIRNEDASSRLTTIYRLTVLLVLFALAVK